MINRNKLRGLMAERSVKQAELAKVIGIAINTFNSKLLGKNQFTEKEIKIIADYFNVDVAFLFY